MKKWGIANFFKKLLVGVVVEQGELAFSETLEARSKRRSDLD